MTTTKRFDNWIAIKDDFDFSDGEGYFVAPSQFFLDNGHVPDSELKIECPDNFDEVMEHCLEYYGDESAKDELEAVGFTYFDSWEDAEAWRDAQTRDLPL